MAADALGTSDSTPMSVRLMRNVDVVVLPLALILFIAAGWPVVGWLTGAGAWAVQRGINELAVRRAEKAQDVRTRVGLLAGSMILRGWVVAGIIVAVGLGNSDAGLSAAVLFLAVFTLQLTMTMAIRPYDTPAGAAVAAAPQAEAAAAAAAPAESPAAKRGTAPPSAAGVKRATTPARGGAAR
jgi:hypothetical protein